MPTKHNKKRYQRELKPQPKIELSGAVYLQYRDAEEIEAAKKGDLQFMPCADALHTTRQGDYWSTGIAGYFKLDVFDGKNWQPVILTSIFDHRENYFSKSECSIDTFELCAGIVRAIKGKELIRTYREHYTLHEADQGDTEEA